MSKNPVKYIFITGGVVSSLGKGITAASLAYLLESRGMKVALQKFDPYLNVDPGTMNPFQHGEVYVTDDGAETDLDLGHYYRFTNAMLTRRCNATSGQIYETVIKRERRGDYLGKTVQVVPHVTDEIKSRIIACGQQDPDTQVLLLEIGGTVGDIESLPFLEAIRQLRYEHLRDCINIHLTYVPYLKAAGEVKTKPTQHSVQVLRQIGINPDMIFCRCENSLTQEIKEKLSLFCNVPKEAVIEAKDVEYSIYEVPLQLYAQNADAQICQRLGLELRPADLSGWETMLHRLSNPSKRVVIGVVGKYMDLSDAYKSVFEALHHAAIEAGAELVIRKFEADRIIDNGGVESIAGCDGYVVPGGFGERGWLGKILTAQYCREQKIPYFGLCLGMQVMCVEFARHVLGWKEAHSTEVDPNTPQPVISMLSEQKGIENLGGTMRLGAFSCRLVERSKAFAAYEKPLISERHRHRYEFNNRYKKEFEQAGFLFSGTLEGGELCEVSELPSHPWMVGVQYHPEFKSKPLQCHPLFRDFVRAALKKETPSAVKFS